MGFICAGTVLYLGFDRDGIATDDDGMELGQMTVRTLGHATHV